MNNTVSKGKIGTSVALATVSDHSWDFRCVPYDCLILQMKMKNENENHAMMHGCCLRYLNVTDNDDNKHYLNTNVKSDQALSSVLSVSILMMKIRVL